MLPERAAVPVLRLRSSPQSFKRETELLFDSIVREDRSVLDLLDGRLHVRERAAGAPLRHSERDRRRLPPRDARPGLAYRRGLLGQGSMLMLTSVADRTSPVQRGKWIMEVLLGSPPPPPPPNVPALDDTKAVAAGGQTLRRASAWKSTGRIRRARRAIA